MKYKDNSLEMLYTIIIGLVGNAIAFGGMLLFNSYFFHFDLAVNAESIGTYGGLFTGVMSVVFITTSLLSTLSDKADTTYWEATMQYILINPRYRNFYSLSTYSFESLFVSLLGLVVGSGEMVISGSFLSVVVIIWVFYKMTRVYFKKKSIMDHLQEVFDKELALAEKAICQKKNDVAIETIREKIRITVLNTMNGISNNDLDLVKDNLNLLFAIPSTYKMNNEVNPFIVEIYRKLFGENQFMMMPCLEQYRESRNICVLNDFIFNSALSLYETGDNNILKDLLIETYIDKLLEMLKDGNITQENNQNDREHNKFISSGQITKSLAKALFIYKNCSINNDQIDENVIDLLDKINERLTKSTSRTETENFYFYLLDEFLKHKPFKLQMFVEDSIDWKEFAKINEYEYKRFTKQDLGNLSIDKTTVTYHLRFLFVSFKGFDASYTVNNAKNKNEEYTVLRNCLHRILTKLRKPEYCFVVEDTDGTQWLRITDNLRYVIAISKELYPNDMYHLFESINNYIQIDDRILAIKDLKELISILSDTTSSSEDLLGYDNEYIGRYDDAVIKEIEDLIY